MNDKINVTDLEDFRDREKGSKPTTFRERHGDFADIVQETGDKAEWIVCEALSSFYLQRFRTVGNNTSPSGVFFQQSFTHQALFYRLMQRFAACAQSGDDRVGVSQREVVTYMRMPQGRSGRHVDTIIGEGVEAGFVGKADWNRDTRIKLLYLTPESVTDFMQQGLEAAIDASMGNSLPEVHLMLDKHRSEDDAYEAVGDILRRFMQNHTA